jgi:hypothetical protein
MDEKEGRGEEYVGEAKKKGRGQSYENICKVRGGGRGISSRCDRSRWRHRRFFPHSGMNTSDSLRKLTHRYPRPPRQKCVKYGERRRLTARAVNIAPS